MAIAARLRSMVRRWWPARGGSGDEEEDAPADPRALALISCVREGDLAGVRAALDDGADVDCRDWNSWTPLMWAAAGPGGRADIAALLIDRGADLEATNKIDRTALLYAARGGNVDAVRLLIDRGARTDFAEAAPNAAAVGERWTALHFAAERGHVGVLPLLMDADGSLVHARTNEGQTPLHLAARVGDRAVARLLLDRGAAADAANAHGWTPIHRAAWFSHIELTAELLSRGALITLAQNVVASHRRRRRGAPGRGPAARAPAEAPAEAAAEAVEASRQLMGQLMLQAS